MKKIFLLGCILVSSIGHADRVKLLVDDKEALQVRLDLIRMAKHDIRVEYFYVGDDATSNVGLALLQQAARNGRNVKMIVDYGFQRIKRATLLALTKDPQSQGRFQVKFFNQLFSSVSLTHRDHDKQLNIDGEVFITGGRNVGNDYFGLDPVHNFTDLDILVAGHQAKITEKYFDILWDRPEVTPPKYLLTSMQDVKTAQDKIDTALKSLEAGQYASNLTSTQDWISVAKEHEGVRFVFDSPLAVVDETHHAVSDELYKMAIKRERKSLTIVTPYLVPNPRALDAFKKLLARGVTINILTNSLHSTDAEEAQAGYRNSKDELIKMGIEIHEYKGPSTVHAKAAVFENKDGSKVAWVGSFNLDPRSSSLNREIGVFVDDHTDSSFSDELLEFMAHLRENSLIVGKDGHHLNQNIEDQGVSEKVLNEVRARQILFKHHPWMRDQI